MTTKLINSVRKFHSDEEGLEALQVVMIIAIAAMVMIACAAVGKAANKWMGTQATTLFGDETKKGVSVIDGFPAAGGTN